MNNHIKNINNCIKIVERHFNNKKEVHSLFVWWSINNNSTIFSDLDLWIVLQTETDLNNYIKSIKDIFYNLFDLVWFYNSTNTHYFFITATWVQIDLNFVTTAQYFSIKKSKEEHFIIDNKNNFMNNNLSDEKLYFYLLEWYTTLERAISKNIKWDTFTVLKFIDSIRQSSIIPLLNYLYNWFCKNNIEIDIDRLNEYYKRSFLWTYWIPNEESILIALENIYIILESIRKDINIDFEYNFDIQNEKIKKYFNN